MRLSEILDPLPQAIIYKYGPTIRLYRGEGTQTVNPRLVQYHHEQGRYWTPDLELASGYARGAHDQCGAGYVFYIDVPENMPGLRKVSSYEYLFSSNNQGFLNNRRQLLGRYNPETHRIEEI